MPIRVSCPECSQQYQLKDELAGKKVRCKMCQAIVPVPMPKAKPVEAKPKVEYDEVEFEDDSDNDFDWDDHQPIRKSRSGKAIATRSTPKKSRSKPKKRKMNASFLRPEFDSELSLFENWYNNFGKLILLAVLINVLITVANIAAGRSESVRAISEFLVHATFVIPTLNFVLAVIWYFAIALEEDSVCVVLILFVPLYSIYYFISRWESTQMPFFLYLKGFILLPFWVFNIAMLGSKFF